ncbi:MAG: hypothetical protein AB7F23_09060 [Phycisphaerae bacterium]|jgi:hypothetical protein
MSKIKEQTACKAFKQAAWNEKQGKLSITLYPLADNPTPITAALLENLDENF